MTKPAAYASNRSPEGKKKKKRTGRKMAIIKERKGTVCTGSRPGSSYLMGIEFVLGMIKGFVCRRCDGHTVR